MSQPPSTRLKPGLAHTSFKTDVVAGDPETTAWKRTARMRQARWRDARGFPIGAEPYGGGADATPVGSRLDLEFARSTGANFLSAAALQAARERVARRETHQLLREERLWADLLSSMPLCFNLFGELATEPSVATKAVGEWWPDAPSGEVAVRFEHSPGRRDPSFLNNKSAFDVALEVTSGDRTRAIIGIETKYHEHAKPERVPEPAALSRYVEVAERSGAFVPEWRSLVIGTELHQIWLDHLLVLSMLQHPSRQWAWGRFVLVLPAENPSFVRAAQRYRAVLRDPTTFEAKTIENLLDTTTALDAATVSAFRDRYLRDLSTE